MTTQPSAFQAMLPNALSSARLLAAGVVIALLTPLEPVTDARLRWAAGLFIAAAITDALDGFLARRWGVISRFGRIVDPLADKVLVLGAFVCLAGPAFLRNAASDQPWQASGITAAMAAIVLTRELLVTSLRGLVEADGGDFSASLSGKAKMVVQSLAVPLILLTLSIDPALPGTPARAVVLSAAWAATIVTAASAWPYIARAVARQSPQGPSP